MNKPILPEDAPYVRAKVFDLLQSVKLEKFGMKVVDGKHTTVDEHLKPKLRK